MANATDLADVLREAGLAVVETDGWKTRGRSVLGEVKGILCHHTGPGSSEALLNLIIHGRSDLKGPLSNLFLSKDGVYHVVAAGHCNHAGAGYWQGVSDGNGHLIGIEAENSGAGLSDPWPGKQMYAYIVGCAAILKRYKLDPVMCAGHKEYALPKGRKTDPTFDMVAFREALEGIHDVTQASPVPQTTDPVRDMLMKGSRGDSVKILQKALTLLKFYTGNIDGDFGPKTETAVKAFQKAKGLTEDGKVGPKSWTALGVK